MDTNVLWPHTQTCNKFSVQAVSFKSLYYFPAWTQTIHRTQRVSFGIGSSLGENKRITIATVKLHISIPWRSFLSSDSSQQQGRGWQGPPFDTASKAKKSGERAEEVGVAPDTNKANMAEASVMLTGVWALHLTLNYRQTFFSPKVQFLGEIIGTPFAAKVPTHPSLPSAISLTKQNKKKNWLQANNLSLRLAYYWAEVKAMAFCWITFPLINDTAWEKISPGNRRGDSVSIIQVGDGANGWPECITVSRFI